MKAASARNFAWPRRMRAADLDSSHNVITAALKKVCTLLLATAALGSNVAYAQTFVSTRPATLDGEPVKIELSSVPTGSTVLMGDDPVFEEQTRSMTCAEFYGAPPPEVSYSGGPIIEFRLETSPGVFTPWAHKSGECRRHHEYFRTTATCPASQVGEITERRRYTLNDDDEVIEDSGWEEVARNCDFYKVSDATEPRTLACPSNMQGSITEQRSYEIWSDGSFRNHGPWNEVENTCSYYMVSTGTETQTLACPSNMQGQHIQTRTYEDWSDGTKRNYSGWTNQTYTCNYYRVSTEYETSSASCPSGQTGTRTLRRSYELWSDGSKRNYSAYSEISNTCKAAKVCKYVKNNTYVLNYSYNVDKYYYFYVGRKLVGKTTAKTYGNYSIGALDHSEGIGTGGDSGDYTIRRYSQICGPF